MYRSRFLIFKTVLVVAALGALTLAALELTRKDAKLPPVGGIVIGHCPGRCAVQPRLQLDLGDAERGWTAWQQPGAPLHLYRFSDDGRPRGQGWQLPDKRAAQLGHDDAGALIAWRTRQGKRFHLNLAGVDDGRLGRTTPINGDDVLASPSPIAVDGGPQIQQLLWDARQRQLLIVEAGNVPWAGTMKRPCRPYVLITALRGRHLVARERIELGARQSFILPRAAIAIAGGRYLVDLVLPGDNDRRGPQPDVLLERPLSSGLAPLGGWRKVSKSVRGGGLGGPVALQTTAGVWHAWIASANESLAAQSQLTVWVKPPGHAPRPVARFVSATDYPSGLAFTDTGDQLRLSWSDGAQFVAVRLTDDGKILSGQRWLGIGAAAGGAGEASKLLLALDRRNSLRLLRLR